VPNCCTSTPRWCSHGWLLTRRVARPLPAAVLLAGVRDVRADVRDVLAVVRDVRVDREAVLADGLVAALDVLGGTGFPSRS